MLVHLSQGTISGIHTLLLLTYRWLMPWYCSGSQLMRGSIHCCNIHYSIWSYLSQVICFGDILSEIYNSKRRKQLTIITPVAVLKDCSRSCWKLHTLNVEYLKFALLLIVSNIKNHFNWCHTKKKIQNDELPQIAAVIATGRCLRSCRFCSTWSLWLEMVTIITPSSPLKDVKYTRVQFDNVVPFPW